MRMLCWLRRNAVLQSDTHDLELGVECIVWAVDVVEVKAALSVAAFYIGKRYVLDR